MKIKAYFNNVGVCEHDSATFEGKDMDEITEKLESFFKSRNLSIIQHLYYSELVDQEKEK